jgi:hypothetical protein
MAAAHEGRLEDARALLVEAIELTCVLGFGPFGARCCDGLAFVAAASGDAARSARLLGAGEAMRRAAGAYRMPAEAAARGDALAAIREMLSEHAIEDELERGSHLTLDEAAEEARHITSVRVGM